MLSESETTQPTPRLLETETSPGEPTWITAPTVAPSAAFRRTKPFPSEESQTSPPCLRSNSMST